MRVKYLSLFHILLTKDLKDWISKKKKQGIAFTEEQIEWLRMIKDHIATSMSITKEDLEHTPFHNKGGLLKLTKYLVEILIM